MFYKIENSDGKCWLMPMRDVRMGLALYQPSGWKGRLLKRWFPYVHWAKLVRRMLKIEVVEYVLEEELKRVIGSAFGVSGFEFSVFEGTPSVHRKTTIQVWRGERILGYVKLTDSEEVGRLFEREASFLNEMRNEELGIRNVPMVKVVRCGALFVLLQTTRKTLRSKVVHEWGALQENFLKRLYETTAKEIAWEESDVAQALRDLREHVDWLPVGVDGEMVARRIDAVMERMTGKRVKYGAYHGDFTPWNMFVDGEELFVFDWEYVGRRYPMGLDRYHFWMQTALFEKHWGVAELKRYISSDEGKWIDGEMLEMYVLDVMSKYVMREGKKVKELGLFGVWGGMVKGK